MANQGPRKKKLLLGRCCFQIKSFWHYKEIHAKWEDFVLSLNLLRGLCGVHLASGRIVLGLNHQLGGLLWHCKGIHVKWEDFVLSLNLLGDLLWGSLSQWEDCVDNFITNRGIFFKLEFTGRHFEVLI